MSKLRYGYSWDQVQNKWKSLLRTYKSVKDNNNESGRSRKNWMYFDQMDRLLQKNPAIEPPVVIHNGKCTKSKLFENALDKTENTDDSNDSAKKSKVVKTKEGKDMGEILLMAIEESKRQHEEDITEKRKFNALLEKIINGTDK